MPSLRLSPDDARDIASYLITQKHADAVYADASFMDDPKLKPPRAKNSSSITAARAAMKFPASRTKAASAPNSRTKAASPSSASISLSGPKTPSSAFCPTAKRIPRGPWYRPEGLLRNQARPNPGLYDQRQVQTRIRWTACACPSRMSNREEDIDALDDHASRLDRSDASARVHVQARRPARRYIQKGWWIVTKYNCIGCHQIDIGQKSVLHGRCRNIRARTKQNLPPVLTSEGARVNPEWLKAVSRESVAQHHGHEPQRRALVSAGAHAHVLSVRRRDSHARAVL